MTPSSTGLSAPPSTIAGTGFDGQITTVGTPTVMLSALVTLCDPAVSWTVKFDVPPVVGVPAITPLFGDGVRSSPSGSDPLRMTQV